MSWRVIPATEKRAANCFDDTLWRLGARRHTEDWFREHAAHIQRSNKPYSAATLAASGERKCNPLI
jgi:hypothetical protein